MGVPWKRILSSAIPIAGLFIPGLQNAIMVTEQNFGDLKGKGPEKKEAVLKMAAAYLPVIEGVKGEDVLNDAKVLEAASVLVDAEHAAFEAREKFLAALDLFKASVNQPQAPTNGQPTG